MFGVQIQVVEVTGFVQDASKRKLRYQENSTGLFPGPRPRQQSDARIHRKDFYKLNDENKCYCIIMLCIYKELTKMNMITTTTTRTTVDNNINQNVVAVYRHILPSQGFNLLQPVTLLCFIFYKDSLVLGFNSKNLSIFDRANDGLPFIC